MILSLSSLHSDLEKLLLVTIGQISQQTQQQVTFLQVEFQAVSKLQAHFTLSSRGFPFPVPSCPWGTSLFIHVQNLDRVMPLWGYFVCVGPQWFSQEQRGPDQPPEGSPLCFVLIPHPGGPLGRSRGALAGPQASLVPPGPTLDPGDTTHRWVPHQPHSDTFSPNHSASGPFLLLRASPGSSTIAACLSFNPIWERLVSTKGLERHGKSQTSRPACLVPADRPNPPRGKGYGCRCCDKR